MSLARSLGAGCIVDSAYMTDTKAAETKAVELKRPASDNADTTAKAASAAAGSDVGDWQFAIARGAYPEGNEGTVEAALELAAGRGEVEVVQALLTSTDASIDGFVKDGVLVTAKLPAVVAAFLQTTFCVADSNTAVSVLPLCAALSNVFPCRQASSDAASATGEAKTSALSLAASEVVGSRIGTLHEAARLGRSLLLKHLLRKSADPESRDEVRVAPVRVRYPCFFR